MEDRGEQRVAFQLRTTPPASIRARRGGPTKEVPVFEPLRESLPLQSGFYSFVIDGDGHFRVVRGNTRSHSAMVPNRTAAAAGHFEVDRLGRVISVVCQSSDFPQVVRGPADRLAQYVVRSFRDHEAFFLSDRTVFRFSRGRFDPWHIDAGLAEVVDPEAALLALRAEGAGDELRLGGPGWEEAIGRYLPEVPPRLYPIDQDQLLAFLEEGEGDRAFEVAAAEPRLGVGSGPLRAGKNNFVIDQEGWIILGMAGHHILSGNRPVGGAGHAHLAPPGEVTRLEVNFSGHYRPELTADYARCVFRAFESHPLIRLATDCGFAGRAFHGDAAVSRVIEFTRVELESDDPQLDWSIAALFM